MKILSLSWMLTQLVLQIRGQTWHEFEGHCYTVLSVKNNLDTCKFACQQYGSYMVEIEEDPELYYLQTIIEGSNEEFWVGLEFNNVTRKFYWDRDGQEPQESMWLPNEPNFSGRCVELATQAETGSESPFTFLLSDQSCTSSNKVICEKNADMLEVMNYQEVMTSSGHQCPMVTYAARSKIQCARNCSKNKFCTGFQYSDSTQVCTPYRFTINCPSPQIMPLTMYVREFPRC